MKKIKINELSLPSFGGECIGYVLSKYHDKGILCKPVYKRRVRQKKTPKFLEAQERFLAATQFAKHVMDDPKMKQAYESRLTKINGSFYPAIVADYLKNGERSIEDCKRSQSSPSSLPANGKESKQNSNRQAGGKGRGNTKSKR